MYKIVFHLLIRIFFETATCYFLKNIFCNLQRHHMSFVFANSLYSKSIASIKSYECTSVTKTIRPLYVYLGMCPSMR